MVSGIEDGEAGADEDEAREKGPSAREGRCVGD